MRVLSCLRLSPLTAETLMVWSPAKRSSCSMSRRAAPSKRSILLRTTRIFSGSTSSWSSVSRQLLSLMNMLSLSSLTSTMRRTRSACVSSSRVDLNDSTM